MKFFHVRFIFLMYKFKTFLVNGCLVSYTIHSTCRQKILTLFWELKGFFYSGYIMMLDNHVSKKQVPNFLLQMPRTGSSLNMS